MNAKALHRLWEHVSNSPDVKIDYAFVIGTEAVFHLLNKPT
jgi:hypothetical protein